MNKKQKAYWYCQIAGWTFYGISMVFFAWVYDHDLSGIFIQRLILSLIFGISFTHLLRLVIAKINLLPPLFGKQWLYLFYIVISFCVLESLINSKVVEILKLYKPEIKATVSERFFLNLANDSPIILVWLSIYYLWHYIESSRKTQINQVKMEALVKELELKTIKSHINPHFIFNALNSIRALVDENPSRARTAITELSNILRSSMQAEKLETSSLERELDIVKDYLELEHIRFEDRLNVEYDIDEETLDREVPPMMLQTLVENAIKHGISKQINGGTIKIISSYISNYHVLTVINTGNLQAEKNPEGFGITSTTNRLKLIYGAKANFNIRNLDCDLVEAKVLLPLSY